MIKFKNLKTGLVGTATELLAAVAASASDCVDLHTLDDVTPNDVTAWRLIERSGEDVATVGGLRLWVELWEGLGDTELEVLAWLVDLQGTSCNGLVRLLQEAEIFEGTRAECAETYIEDCSGESIPDWALYNTDWEGVFDDLVKTDECEALGSGVIIINAYAFYNA